MLKITPKTDRNLRTLSHSPGVFHKALKYVLLGERCFHVKHPDGADYDLCYYENDQLFQEGKANVISFDNAVLPPYFHYDETDMERIDFSVFDGCDTVLFEEVNEYTVVIAKLLSSLGTMRIVFLDERIRLFLPGQIECLKEDSEEVRRIRSSAGVFLCSSKPGSNGVVVLGRSELSSEFLFHNIFLWQWLTDLPMSRIRYVYGTVLKSEGIGAVLDHYMRTKRIFAEKGLETFLRLSSTRFPEQMLRRFFHFEDPPEDMDASNTIFLENFMPLRVSVLFLRSDGRFREDMLNEQFYREISFYYDEVLRNRKVLGVLIRGTDYVNLKMEGSRKHARPDEMIPVIDAWIREEGFEEIFLATEDADILDEMRARYGNRLVTVSQERYRISDFKPGENLADVEKRKSRQDQETVVEDTVANYFYALVILSKCAGFLCSGQCNGWDVVNDLNDGRFLRSECMSLLQENND